MLKITADKFSVLGSFCFITLQGLPTAIELLGMFLFTKEFEKEKLKKIPRKFYKSFVAEEEVGSIFNKALM